MEALGCLLTLGTSLGYKWLILMQQYNCCSVFVTFNFKRQWWILWVLQVMHSTRYKYGNSRCFLQLLTLSDFFILSTLWCFYACHCDFKISFSNKKKVYGYWFLELSCWEFLLYVVHLKIELLLSCYNYTGSYIDFYGYV